MKLIKQTIESQYLDLEKLSDKLTELFPGVDCEVEVSQLARIPRDTSQHVVLIIPVAHGRRRLYHSYHSPQAD